MRSPTVLLPAVAVILFGTAASPPPGGAAPFPQPTSWPSVATIEHATEQVGPGVTYDRWRLSTGIGPLTVYVTTVDVRNPDVSLSVATHRGQIVGAGEPLSSMADRERAEAAINADYFDINETGAPLNVVAVGGRFVHQPDGAAALAVGPGNAITMGPVTLHATVADAAGSSLQIGSINDWSKEAGLSLLTPEFGTTALDADIEAVLVPVPSGGYRVAAIIQNPTQLAQLGVNDLGIVARGAEQVGRLSAFALGDLVSVTYTGDPAPASVVWAVGGGPMLLRNGVAVTDAAAPAAQETNVRYPVTGAGLSADGATLWLVAVDGRAPDRSVGITRPMLGSLLAALGAAQAMAFDSGGSTEMVVRHLGDPSVSVANVPSDGKERSIADALLIQNAAPPGPVAQILLRAATPAVLVGSHLQLRAAAIDANMQPVGLAPSSVGFAVDGPCCASVDKTGAVTGLAAGAATVVGRSGAVASSPLAITVVTSPAALSIAGYARDVAAGAAIPLSIVATTGDGKSIAVDSTAVRWSAAGDGRMLAGGTFVGGTSPGIATISAQAGGVTSSLRMLVGEHPEALVSAHGWRFSSSPATVGGAVDGTPAPDGSPGLHLDYDFSQGGATRAAYAESEIPVSGEPLAISVDVFGDGNGEWLRGGYRNADGIVDSVTFARHVDWTGWKTIRVTVPAQVRWPIAWTRLYAAEPRQDAIESGDLWFRNLLAMYAGPRAP
jgi:hypothetical protein